MTADVSKCAACAELELDRDTWKQLAVDHFSVLELHREEITAQAERAADYTHQLRILKDARGVGRGASRMISRIYSKLYRTWLSALTRVTDRMVVTVPGVAPRMRVHASTPLTWWRAKTALTKEPETIAWIDSMKPGDFFYDVGANIGVYSIYAALKGLHVYSFEPESSNYAELNRNIQLNVGNPRRINAFCLAISDRERADYLRLSQIQTGGAHHAFGKNLDIYGNGFQPVHEQGCFAMSLDHLTSAYQLPIPNYLKIDVDGLEFDIVNGMAGLLDNLFLRSILIELGNTSLDLKVVAKIEAAGFTLTTRGAPEGRTEIRNLIFYRNGMKRAPIESTSPNPGVQ